MSGNINNIKYIEYTESYNPTILKDEKENKSSIEIFNASLPQHDGKKVYEQNNTDYTVVTQRRDIDVSELTNEYEDNPIGVLSVLGIEFSDEQIAELKETLTDEKRLESFLTIVEKTNLNTDDIMAAVEKSKEFKNSGFFSRVWNVVKTTFTDGLSEAVDLAKSERVYYTDKLSTNMSEIRQERKDFSSEGLAGIADMCVREPEIKNETMHFVTAKAEKGKHIYTENDVTNAVEFMYEKPQEAPVFLENAQELESIKDADGKMKYTGSTIINVDKRMVNNKKLQPTMMKAAHKTDMTNEYLENITGNLEKNPEMQCAIDYSLDAKNPDGTDKLSAYSINCESNHLVTKSGEYCKSYTQNLQELSSYDNLSSEDIVTIANNITTHPEIKQEVMSHIESGNMSGSEVAEYTNQLVKETYNTENTASQSGYSANNLQNTSANNSETQNKQSQTETQSTNNSTATSTITNKKPDIKLNTSASKDINNNSQSKESIELLEEVSDGKVSEQIYNTLYTYFGTMTDAIITKIQKDPGFIEVIKACNGNKVLIEAQLNNPGLINKIKAAAGNLTQTQLADAIMACSTKDNTNLVIAAFESCSANQALKTARQSKISNSQQDALEILTSTKSNSDKQNELEQLYGVGRNREFVA